MTYLARTIRSREIVLVLLLLILANVLGAALIPQRITTIEKEMEAWKEAYPIVAPWVDRLGLDHIFTTPWFTAILALFLIVLLLSLWDQIKIAQHKSFTKKLVNRKWTEVNTPLKQIYSGLRKLGYIQVGSHGSDTRFVKHPWGFWGESILHLGMVIIIASSLVMALFQQRGFLELTEGTEHGPHNLWLGEEQGLLADSFMLPVTFRLDHVVPEYWDTFDLKSLTAIISFLKPNGESQQTSIILGQKSSFFGFEIMLLQSFGRSFYLELTDTAKKVERLILMIPAAKNPDRPGIESIQVNEDNLLQGKYFADAEKSSLYSTNPLLALRINDRTGSTVSEEVTLLVGGSAQIGPYKVHLVKASNWAGFVFMRLYSMPGIYLGFAFIVFGAMLIFFTPPREMLLKNMAGEKVAISWRAYKFARFYQDEYEQLLQDCRK